MVGIFSKISGQRRSCQQRSHLHDCHESVVHSGEMVVLVPTASGAYAFELGTEFKPIDHPSEPQDHDQPVRFPMPGPSILNDARVWKERFGEGNQRKADIPVMKDHGAAPTSSHPAQAASKRHQPARHDQARILPSFSAPEHNIASMLREFDDLE